MQRRRKTAFVPRAVKAVSFAGVIPACVIVGLEACGQSTVPPGVAAVAYCCFDQYSGVAEDAFAVDTGTSDARDAEASTDSATDSRDGD